MARASFCESLRVFARLYFCLRVFARFCEILRVFASSFLYLRIFASFCKFFSSEFFSIESIKGAKFFFKGGIFVVKTDNETCTSSFLEGTK